MIIAASASAATAIYNLLKYKFRTYDEVATISGLNKIFCQVIDKTWWQKRGTTKFDLLWECCNTSLTQGRFLYQPALIKGILVFQNKKPLLSPKLTIFKEIQPTLAKYCLWSQVKGVPTLFPFAVLQPGKEGFLRDFFHPLLCQGCKQLSLQL